MRLKFYLDKKGKKIYTLKSDVSGNATKDAHYKFIKIRDAPKS